MTCVRKPRLWPTVADLAAVREDVDALLLGGVTSRTTFARLSRNSEADISTLDTPGISTLVLHIFLGTLVEAESASHSKAKAFTITNLV